MRVVNSRRGSNFMVTFAVSATRGLINHDVLDDEMTMKNDERTLSQLSREDTESPCKRSLFFATFLDP